MRLSSLTFRGRVDGAKPSPTTLKRVVRRHDRCTTNGRARRAHEHWRVARAHAAMGRPRDFFGQRASGSGRTWICTARGLEPLPPSISHGVRSPFVLQIPRPFQPAFGSSIRPSSPLAKNPSG